MPTDQDLVVSVPTTEQLERLDPPAGVRVIEWDLQGPAPESRIDLVVLPYMSALDVLDRLDGVETRLVQSPSIGYDGYAERLPAGHVLANAAGVHEASTAELAVGMVIASQRRIPLHVRNQERGVWGTGLGLSRSLADQRVLVLGYGGVGRAIADRLAPFETDVTVVASRARDVDGRHVHGIDELPALLPETDVVIVVVPLSDATRHLVDDTFLTALPDGALVVNAARGPVADTDALVDHVRRGRIRLALDVTDPEPLPEGHPLWALDDVLITPHVGGASTAMQPRLRALVLEQIDRLVRDEAPVNVVLGG
ncbi:2-hydroxyacid dehydrogenase [Pseudoclavibacter chungangensis]|uniref:2-hydroxyacid dehydrogenase n=1 Tax=Pseudoclavibacter chungangensis TaxID=587635 RepID=A0A7J5C3Q8_9MICO|nr:2-hydroxyacid dehydrogenase [Pseudoclavibacter chungangensis]KAB1662409.1 2-hydroxyacid dehydrogenase [Pseudoclavibacter chungangensis]NYJ68434.1 phosphoglycerate dehydrogenase-like enzyme [Pseudoclavibacter chungangensis]